MRAVIRATLILGLAACSKSDAPLAPVSTNLVPGLWGSNDVQVIVTDSVIQVRVVCDAGQFAGNITPDASGRFTSNGTWTQNFLASFYFPTPVPAQMSGQVAGTTLTFSVGAAVSDGQSAISVGPMTAVLGATASFGACGV